MQKFVKVRGFDEWFMLLERPEDVPENLPEMMQIRMKQSVSKDLFQSAAGLDNMLMGHLSTIAHNAPDYVGMIQQHGTILVREKGSWMTLGKMQIVEEVESTDYPTDSVEYDIVVCENDAHAPKEWLDYLSLRFPGRAVHVISYFRSRDDEYVKSIFQKCNLITFSTTFTSFDWFHKLVNNLPDRQVKIVGRSSNKKSWVYAQNIIFDKNKNVELEVV